MQRKKDEKLQCFVCGKTGKGLTNDHVPPKGLFLKPLPTDLITVPSHQQCNEGYKLDEEYFRATLAVQARSEKGLKVWEEKVVGSSFKRSSAFAKHLANNLTNIPVYTQAGIYLGQAGAINLDGKRIHRVVEKMARGLYRHHFPDIDLNDLGFTVFIPKKEPAMSRKELDLLSQLKSETIGDGSFIYWRGVLEGEPKYSLWYLLFYGHVWFHFQTAPVNPNPSASADI